MPIEKVLKTEVSDDLKTVRVLALGADQRLWINELDLEPCTWSGWKEVSPPPLPGQQQTVERKRRTAKRAARTRKQRSERNPAKNKRGGGRSRQGASLK